MPCGGTRSISGLCSGGSALMHGVQHALVLLRPGDREHAGIGRAICSGSAPMQPVTMTRPFSAMASPMAASDSALALSRKPQVLTMTRSAPSCLRDSSYPSARRR
jgi:hypothetical protein